MSIHLERNDLINPQQLEVAVNGPDGATHLILCTGVADAGPASQETYSFLVGPQISRRQFVGAIASAALSSVQRCEMHPGSDNHTELDVNLHCSHADYDDESGQVKVSVEVSCGTAVKLAISYNVSILAELPIS